MATTSMHMTRCNGVRASARSLAFRASHAVRGTADLSTQMDRLVSESETKTDKDLRAGKDRGLDTSSKCAGSRTDFFMCNTGEHEPFCRLYEQG